jgi:hypothetical protein
VNATPSATPDPRRVDFDRRLSIALGTSVRAGMDWEKAAPPGARWLWRHGVRMPPTHLMPFWWNALLLGVLWGVPMTLFFIGQNLLMYGRVNVALLLVIGVAGALAFGLGMAAVLRGATRGRDLPRWRDIRADDPDADPGLCVRCGYDFTGATGPRCAECGWTPGS